MTYIDKGWAVMSEKLASAVVNGRQHTQNTDQIAYS